MENYKGIMMSERPQPIVKGPVETLAFQSRVNPKDRWGLCPTKKLNVNTPRKSGIKPAIKRHAQWLEEYKVKVKLQKELQELGQNTNDFKIQQRDTNEKLQTHRQRNDVKANEEASKPKWAYTDDDHYNEENKGCEDLLDFVKNLNYEQYLDDLEVKTILGSINKRINQLKQKPDMRKTMNFEPQQYSSQQHEQQSQPSILKKKFINKEWDKTTTQNSEKPESTLFVKKLAEEVLKNNKVFREVHSHKSVQKILQREAN